jgi:xylulokinase
MYTVNKILWLKDICPEVFEKTWKFCCVEDYIIYRLTEDQPVIDYSLAARTMLFDVVKKEWSEKFVNWQELTPESFLSCSIRKHSWNH